MQLIVSILMTLGLVTFLTGLFIFTKNGLQNVKVVRILKKEYKLWHFVLATVGSGILLIMSSTLIYKQSPNKPKQDSHLTQPAISNNLKYELTSILSDFKNETLESDISRFQHEYQKALLDEDEKTMGLLKMEMEYKLNMELENQGYTATQAKQEIKRIMGFIQEKPK